MTRQPHDALAKQFLADLLEPLGRATSSFDVFFVPVSSQADAPELLGVFASIGTTPCALEVFCNAPDDSDIEDSDIEDSLNKLYGLRADQRRRTERGAGTPAELPQLWVLSPTLSESFRERFGAVARPDWLSGVYAAPAGYRMNLIAIHQLPVTPETLMLRVLGRGQVQRAAVEEVRALPESPTVERVLELLENWRDTIELRDNRSIDEEEVLMNLSPAYLRWREENRQEGHQEGRLEERREMVETALRVCFGELDPALAQIVPAILALPTEETMRLVMTCDREQLLERFQS